MLDYRHGVTWQLASLITPKKRSRNFTAARTGTQTEHTVIYFRVGARLLHCYRVEDRQWGRIG